MTYIGPFKLKHFLWAAVGYNVLLKFIRYWSDASVAITLWEQRCYMLVITHENSHPEILAETAVEILTSVELWEPFHLQVFGIPNISKVE